MNIDLNINPKPHFVLVPLLAQGHMIPMIDMAQLIADRGALVSFITTPVNAARIKPIVDRTKASGLPVRFIEFDLHRVGGVPEGCESFELLPSQDLFKALFDSIAFLQEPLQLYLRETKPRPSCIISDYCNHWTMTLAQEFSIPRFIFHGPSCFFILCSHNIRQYKVYETLDDYLKPFVVPNLPQEIEVTRAQAPGWLSDPGFEKMKESVDESEAAASGFVVNTFYELEPEYIDCCAKAMGKMVWPVGPLSMYNKDIASKATRGRQASIDEHQVLGWLDSMEPRSVLYANFGSLVRTRPTQLIEIGCGLEASNRPFLWVIKEAEKCAEVEKWMAGGFEERTRERSLIITGWAPQVVILSHPSVGGFMTHCGWNSILEAVSAGVPMITWPHFVDQFLNERLVMEVLRIGVAIGVKVPFYLVKEDEMWVKREEVEMAVVSLMDGGEEGEERRKRAREFGEKAHRAMEEGGSSYENLTMFIQYVTDNAKRDV